MAKAFNLNANITLTPVNISQVAQQIRNSLNAVVSNINVNIKLGSTSRNLDSLQRHLDKVNITLVKIANNARTATTAINALGQGLQNLSNIGNGNIKIVQNLGNVSNAAKTATTSVHNFGEQAGRAFRRFSAYAITTAPIFGLIAALKSGLTAALEFDSQMVKLSQITGITTRALSPLSAKITDLSIEFGVSSAELQKAAIVLTQAGISAADTKVALEALANASLAPSFADMATTAEDAVAIFAQFKINAKDLAEVLDVVNQVSKEFPVEAKDITEAVKRAGAVFASLNVGVTTPIESFKQFVAVFNTVKSTTQESSESIATGLRTIFTRFQRPATIEALKQFGVNLRDLKGNFVGVLPAVREVQRVLGNLDPRSERFAQIVELVGGIRQIGKFLPVVTGQELFEKSLQTANRASGSTAEDARKAQEALLNALTKTRENFEAFVRDVAGTDTFRNIVSGLLSTANAFVNVGRAISSILPILVSFGAAKLGVTVFREFKDFAGAAFGINKLSANIGRSQTALGNTSAGTASTIGNVRSNIAAAPAFSNLSLAAFNSSLQSATVVYQQMGLSGRGLSLAQRKFALSMQQGSTATEAFIASLNTTKTILAKQGIFKKGLALGGGLLNNLPLALLAGGAFAPGVEKGSALSSTLSNAGAGGIIGASIGNVIPIPGASVALGGIGAAIGGVRGFIQAREQIKANEALNDATASLQKFQTEIDNVTAKRSTVTPGAGLGGFVSRLGQEGITADLSSQARSIVPEINKIISDEIRNNPRLTAGQLASGSTAQQNVARTLAVALDPDAFAKAAAAGVKLGNNDIAKIIKDAFENNKALTASQIKLEKQLKAATDAYLSSITTIDNLVIKFEILSDVIGALNFKLAQQQETLQNSIAKAQGGQVFDIRSSNARNAINILNNPAAFSNDTRQNALRGGINSLFGGNADLQKAADVFTAAENLADKLPDILKEAVIQSRRAIPEGGLDQFKVLEDIILPSLNETEATIIAPLLRQLEEKLVSSQEGNKRPIELQEILQAFKRENVKSNASVEARKVLLEAFKSTDDALKQFAQNINQVTQIIANEKDARLENQQKLQERIRDIRGQFGNAPIDIEGARQPLANRIRGLTGVDINGGSPVRDLQIGLNRADRLRDNALRDFRNAENPQEREEAAKKFIAAGIEVDNFKKALTALTQGTKEASEIQQKLNEIDKARQAGRGLQEKLLTGGPDEQLKTVRNLGAFALFGAGQGGNNPFFNKAAFEGRDLLAQTIQDPAQREKFLARFAQQGNKLLPPELLNGPLGALLQLGGQEKGKADKEQELIDRLEELSTVEADAVTALQDNANSIGLAAEALQEIAGFFQDRGGIEAKAAGGLVGGTYRGRDSVLTYLTPGEFVVNRNATHQNLGLLSAINGGTNQIGQGFANGGLVSNGAVLDSISLDKFSGTISRLENIINKFASIEIPETITFNGTLNGGNAIPVVLTGEDGLAQAVAASLVPEIKQIIDERVRSVINLDGSTRLG